MTKKLSFIKKPSVLAAIGLVALLIAGAALLLTNLKDDGTPVPPRFPSVYFDGEYRIGDGEWREVKAGEHIPATRGDVTLRGTFHMTLDGEYLGPMDAGIPIAFNMDHIMVTVYETGNEPYVMDTENPMCGVSGCGQMWIGYSLHNGGQETLELVIHNPHRFGNETAVDDLLSDLSVWVSADFDREALSLGSTQRNLAFTVIILSLVFLGTALFSSLLRFKNSKYVWLIGLSVLCAGGYMLYSSDAVSFWSENVTLNTTMLCICAIFYMLFASSLAACALNGTKKIGVAALTAFGAFDAVILLVPIFTDVFIYDMLWVWAIGQSLLGCVMSVLLVVEFLRIRKPGALFLPALTLPFIGFSVDLIGIANGYWGGGKVSAYAFSTAVVFAIIFVLKVIPKSIVAMSRAKEMEAEKQAMELQLQESRISIMLSQIQPHFLYNTLNSIYQLCETNPMLARSMVYYFSEYLRNNLSSLDERGLIPFETELSHIKTYLEIEKIRFDDTLDIEYDIECVGFHLPVLTVQPLVENAVKHGTSKKRGGGKVTVSTKEDADSYIITVKDTGCGFDPSQTKDDGKRHVGIENVRQRLSNMCAGLLTIDSEIGTGTTATVRIPKEAKNENHSSR